MIIPQRKKFLGAITSETSKINTFIWPVGVDIPFGVHRKVQMPLTLSCQFSKTMERFQNLRSRPISEKQLPWVKTLFLFLEQLVKIWRSDHRGDQRALVVPCDFPLDLMDASQEQCLFDLFR